MSEARTHSSVNKSRKVKRLKSGVYRVGNHTIHHGDCVATLDGIASASIDVVVTSPPYNINLGYNSHKDDMEEEEYLTWMEQVCSSLRRVMKDDGSFFLNISGSNRKPWLPFMLASRMRSLFALQNHFIWVKSIAVERETSGHFKPIAGERFTHQNHEHIFHFTKTGNVKLDRLAIGVPFADKSNIGRFGHSIDLRCRGNTWFIPYKTVNSRAQKFSHPGTFPVDLPLWCIYLHGKPNACVLDPFVGSGTSIVAAEFSNSRGIGIEVDQAYVDTAVKRVAQDMEECVHIKLNSAEKSILLRQDPATKSDGGFQGLLVKLQERLNKTTGELTLDADDLRRIPKYAFDYNQGGWEDRLKGIFSRHLGAALGR